MTTLRDAIKQALDVLQGILDLEDRPYDPFDERDLADRHWKALESLRAALAEPDEVAAAVAAEREACARIADSLTYRHEIAVAIRARGER